MPPITSGAIDQRRANVRPIQFAVGQGLRQQGVAAVSAALSVGVAMPLTSEPMATAGASNSHLAALSAGHTAEKIVGCVATGTASLPRRR